MIAASSGSPMGAALRQAEREDAARGRQQLAERDADRGPDRRRNRGAPGDRAQDLAARGAERRTDPDFARPPRDRERQNRVGAGHREQQRYAAERRADAGEDRAILAADVAERHDVAHLDVRIEPVHRLAKRSDQQPGVALVRSAMWKTWSDLSGT
jgi:hypothetical protein